MRIAAVIVICVAGCGSAFAQLPQPAHTTGDAGDFEPSQMLDGPEAMPTPEPVESPQERLARCEAALAAAKKRADAAQGLFKDGILAQVEVETRYAQVVKAEKEMADATVAVDAAHADAVKKSLDAHESTQTDLDAANASLKSAKDAAAAASAAWDQSQLDAATLNLQRKRKLYAEGVCSERELQVAEDRLVLLTGTLPK